MANKIIKRSKIRIFLFFIILTLFSISPLFAREVKVRVFSKYDIRNAVITSGDKARGKCFLKLEGNTIVADYNGKDTEKAGDIRVFGGAYGRYTIDAAGQTRLIPGSIDAVILKDEKGIALITTIDIEDYVPCVLASEEDDSMFSPEMAKAHAIVIRTFATLNNERHKYYDFCDLTHCEVFKGIPANEKKWDAPVIATKGMILSGDCAKDSAYFSACCGGITENAGEFATGRPGKCGEPIQDSLNGVPLCREHRYFRWVKTVARRDLENALSSFVPGANPEITGVTISARTQSGRAKELKFFYKCSEGAKSAVVDANRYFSVFGKEAGWALIPSKFFEVEKQGDIFVFTGRGHGHGVGLCLQGAHTLALMGKSYRQILQFYFPDLGISSINF
jgi:stage II sporulation protein D